MESITALFDRFKPVIYVLRCALNNTTPGKGFLKTVNPEKLRALCRFHGVNAMAAMVVLSAEDAENVLSPGEIKEWSLTKSRALGKYLTVKDETDLVCGALAKKGIRFTKLKGMVIGNYYPKPGMREMSDVDLLIDSGKREQAREVLESFGYKPEAFGQSNHDVYEKPPMLCFEIHDELFTRYHRRFYDYYINCREKMLTDPENPFELRFTDEDFYIYQLVHSSKHLYDSGVGLRALTDIYVFLNKFTARREYIDRELKVLGIDREERVMSSLAYKLFSPEKPLDELSFTPEEENILAIILQSGANGTLSQSIKNQGSRDIFAENTEITGRNKRAYIRSRLFPKPEAYEISHPFFYKHKAFRPLLVFVRIGESLFRKKGELTRELKMLSRVSDKNRKL